jgi:hypothetical protein
VPNITTSTVLVPLPAGWTDSGPLKYQNQNADLAFAVLYTVGAGNVIVIGHSGGHHRQRGHRLAIAGGDRGRR